MENSESTIAVGSVAELANLLAYMTPEQLQNVQLDPVLYNALSQTIEPGLQLTNEANNSNEIKCSNLLHVAKQNVDHPAREDSSSQNNILTNSNMEPCTLNTTSVVIDCEKKFMTKSIEQPANVSIETQPDIISDSHIIFDTNLITNQLDSSIPIVGTINATDALQEFLPGENSLLIAPTVLSLAKKSTEKQSEKNLVSTFPSNVISSSILPSSKMNQNLSQNIISKFPNYKSPPNTKKHDVLVNKVHPSNNQQHQPASLSTATNTQQTVKPLLTDLIITDPHCSKYQQLSKSNLIVSSAHKVQLPEMKQEKRSLVPTAASGLTNSSLLLSTKDSQKTAKHSTTLTEAQTLTGSNEHARKSAKPNLALKEQSKDLNLNDKLVIKATIPSPNCDNFFKKNYAKSFKIDPNKKEKLIKCSEPVDEVEQIRNAISSSKVAGEDALRELAKLEIENQIKRFQKNKHTKPIVSQEPKTEVNESEDYVTKYKLNLKKRKMKILDAPRKRERPKKFEDFFCTSEIKKGKLYKKQKNKKYFFPAETEENTERKTMNKNSFATQPPDEITVMNNETTGHETDNDEITVEETTGHETDNDEIITNNINVTNHITNTISTNDSKNKNVETVQTKHQIEHSDVKNTSTKQELPPSDVTNTSTKPELKKLVIKKKRKRKQKNRVDESKFDVVILPEHLKKVKTKPLESAVIDVSKIKFKNNFQEVGFHLNETVDVETVSLLEKSDWVCTLCSKPGSIGTLDVLFGEYKIKIKDSSNLMSVWLHRDCAIWTSSICLADQSLLGVGQALDYGAKTKCTLCSCVGATLSCGSKQCRDGYHYVCAKQRGCSFKLESFTIICPKHK